MRRLRTALLHVVYWHDELLVLPQSLIRLCFNENTVVYQSGNYLFFNLIFFKLTLIMNNQVLHLVLSSYFFYYTPLTRRPCNGMLPGRMWLYSR